MKKIKQVFPSRNYITVDSYGDVEVIFNPVGDGFEGDDKLMFRKGRWAFRVNDFLSGKVMADGSKEGMGRKVYSLNLVYDDENGEPIVNTTYVDPTSVIPLDGSVVDVVGSEKLAQRDLQEKILSELENWLVTGNQDSGYYSVAEALYNVMGDLNVVASGGATAENQRKLLTALSSDIYNKIEAVENSVDSVGSTLDSLKVIVDGICDLVDTRATIAKQDEMISDLKQIRYNIVDEGGSSVADDLNYIFTAFSNRFRARSCNTESIGGNKRYSAGTVFYFGTNRFISLRSDCITISIGSDFLLLGDMSEYNNGTVKRLDGVKFAQSDVTKIVS